MPTKKLDSGASVDPRAAPGVRVVVVPVVVGPSLATTPREKIDVRHEFVDFKIAQLTDAELVDQLGMVKKAGKDLEKWEGLAVNVLKGRMRSAMTTLAEEIQLAGEKYNAILTGRNRRAISLEKLKAKFGEVALEDCYADTVVETLNVKPLE